MQTPPAIRFNSIEQVFPATTGAPTHALSGLDFTIGRHEFVSVLGPSGCGKSTLLRLLAGLMLPSAGKVEVFGNPVREPRDDVGIVFQRPTLLPWLSVIVGLSQAPAPVPRFALGGYMACFVVGTVIYMSADNERWHSFLGPMVRIFSIEDAGLRRSQLLILAFLPLLVGWVAFRQLVPISRTPSVIRVQPPALPDEFASLVMHMLDNVMLNGTVVRLDGAIRMQPI